MSIQFNHLPVIPLRITSKFGKRNTGIQGASTYHKGIDMGRDFSKPETVILAVAPGRIVDNYWNDTRGWVVIIDHGDFQTLYQHLKAQSSMKKDAEVRAGEQIGIMGASTKTIKGMAAHLHFELRIKGQCVDPLPYLQNIKSIKEEEEEMKRYNNAEDLPKALQPEIKALIEAGALKGDEKGNLNITEDMARCLIIAKRYADSREGK